MLIGVTEPRRIAATNMAARVAKEMNLLHGQVAHQVTRRANLLSFIGAGAV
jgi:ATP-dependent RNA helicase DHX37/DHR1